MVIYRGHINHSTALKKIQNYNLELQALLSFVWIITKYTSPGLLPLCDHHIYIKSVIGY